MSDSFADERRVAVQYGFDFSSEWREARRFATMSLETFTRIYRPYSPFKLMSEDEFAEVFRCLSVSARYHHDYLLTHYEYGSTPQRDDSRAAYERLTKPSNDKSRPVPTVQRLPHKPLPAESRSFPIARPLSGRVGIDPSFRDDHYPYMGSATRHNAYVGGEEEEVEVEPWSYYMDDDWDGSDYFTGTLDDDADDDYSPYDEYDDE